MHAGLKHLTLVVPPLSDEEDEPNEIRHMMNVDLAFLQQFLVGSGLYLVTRTKSPDEAPAKLADAVWGVPRRMHIQGGGMYFRRPFSLDKWRRPMCAPHHK